MKASSWGIALGRTGERGFKEDEGGAGLGLLGAVGVMRNFDVRRRMNVGLGECLL